MRPCATGALDRKRDNSPLQKEAVDCPAFANHRALGSPEMLGQRSWKPWPDETRDERHVRQGFGAGSGSSGVQRPRRKEADFPRLAACQRRGPALLVASGKWAAETPTRCPARRLLPHGVLSASKRRCSGRVLARTAPCEESGGSGPAEDRPSHLLLPNSIIASFQSAPAAQAGPHRKGSRAQSLRKSKSSAVGVTPHARYLPGVPCLRLRVPAEDARPPTSSPAFLVLVWQLRSTRCLRGRTRN